MEGHPSDAKEEDKKEVGDTSDAKEEEDKKEVGAFLGGGAEPGLGTLWNRFLGTVHPAGPIPSFGGSASDRCLDRFSTTRRPADPGKP